MNLTEYKKIVKLVRKLDGDLTSGRRYYWSKQGDLLTHLDQVVEAILSNNLLTVEDVSDE